MQLTARAGVEGVAVVSGVTRRVLLDLLPEAQVGDYVIVHAGYAIQRLDESEAADILATLRELCAVTGDDEQTLADAGAARR
jgi:hydrogenase expression/formation protein HypC